MPTEIRSDSVLSDMVVFRCLGSAFDGLGHGAGNPQATGFQAPRQPLSAGPLARLGKGQEPQAPRDGTSKAFT
jgi:hypothetical protein